MGEKAALKRKLDCFDFEFPFSFQVCSAQNKFFFVGKIHHGVGHVAWWESLVGPEFDP